MTLTIEELVIAREAANAILEELEPKNAAPQRTLAGGTRIH